MPRTHQRDYFYKYMSVGTAIAVLENSSLRWREPSQFNDPFDHQICYIFPNTKEELASALAAEIEELVYKREAVFKEKTSISSMVKMLRARRDNIPKKEFLETLMKNSKKSEENLQKYQNNINSLINTVLNRSRVLCVTESKDNVVMWSHYADEHKGVCIRLHCIDEIDNSLLIAKPVQYVDKYPVFPSVKEHVHHLTGEEPLDISQLTYKIPFFKHKHWAYEREWRVHVPHEDASNKQGYDDWREKPRVFGALYFGCRISSLDASNLMQIVESQYPHMEVYKSKPSSIKFQLEFERLK